MSISLPLISVVIPTYNRSNALRRALQSLVLQTYKEFEVIICDDGSSDDTKKVVTSFSDKLNIVYLWEENWGGPARPRNNGCRIANGKYIAFLDSDDWWTPGKLFESINRLENDYDVLYHDLWDVKREHQLFLRRAYGVRPLHKPVFNDLMNDTPALLNSSVVVRANILRQVGGFSEDRDLIGAEDYDCWIRLSKISDRFVYLPKVLGYYWSGGGNISNPERTIMNYRKIIVLHLGIVAEKNYEKLSTFYLYIFLRSIFINDTNESMKISKILSCRKMTIQMRCKVLIICTIIWIHRRKHLIKYLNRKASTN